MTKSEIDNRFKNSATMYYYKKSLGRNTNLSISNIPDCYVILNANDEAINLAIDLTVRDDSSLDKAIEYLKSLKLNSTNESEVIECSLSNIPNLTVFNLED